MQDDNEVHVVDDDEAVRESLSFLLSTVGFDARTYESGEDFMAALPHVNRGCLITDVRMPGMSGIDLLRQVQRTGKPLAVIVVTGHGDVELAVEAMKLGATDFLEKPYDDESLIAAVQAACRDGDRAAEQQAEREAFAARYESLSNRERQVLERLVAGQQNKEMAYELGISPRTIEVYRANVMSKMQAGSVSALVRMSVTAGLNDENSPQA